jgi:hypothetical protein
MISTRPAWAGVHPSSIGATVFFVEKRTLNDSDQDKEVDPSLLNKQRELQHLIFSASYFSSES